MKMAITVKICLHRFYSRSNLVFLKNRLKFKTENNPAGAEAMRRLSQPVFPRGAQNLESSQTRSLQYEELKVHPERRQWVES